MQGQRKNIVGERYGTFIVTELIIDKHKGKSRRRYLCKCDCGRNKTVLPYNLIKGKTICDCQRKQWGLIGKHRNFYNKWANMMMRCYKPNGAHFNSYGGRGIGVCDRWHKFKFFFEDMYPSYKKGLTLDRVDNNGHYEPENCRWANNGVQARNQRSNILVEYRGKQMILADFADAVGIVRSTAYSRIQRGLPLIKDTRIKYRVLGKRGA